jgi:hypothetical protein
MVIKKIILFSFISICIYTDCKSQYVSFKNIIFVTDSLFKDQRETNQFYSKYLVYLLRITQSKDKECLIQVKELHNYFELKYYKFNFISTDSHNIVLFNIDSIYLQNIDSLIIRRFIQNDSLLLRCRLLNEKGAFINSHKQPLLFQVQKDGTLVYIKKEEDYIDNPQLLPPMRIEKYKW